MRHLMLELIVELYGEGHKRLRKERRLWQADSHEAIIRANAVEDLSMDAKSPNHSSTNRFVPICRLIGSDPPINECINNFATTVVD
jgi:hypothetical protein